MAQHCINKSNKEFIELSNKLNIHPNSLAGVIETWQNANNSDEFPSEDYIKERYGLIGKSNSTYQSRENYEKIKEVWQTSFSEPIEELTKEEVKSFYESIKPVFNSEDIKVIPHNDGKYTIKVLEPVYKKPTLPVSESTKESTVEKIPKEFIKEAVRRQKYYSNTTLKPSEREYLSSQIVNLFSNLVDTLEGSDINLSSDAAKKIYLPEKFHQTDFQGMTRLDIINHIGAQTLIEAVQNTFFDPLNADGVSEEASDKLGVAFDNFDLLLESTNHKLGRLEGVMLDWQRVGDINTSESETLLETIDFDDFGEKPRESWILGHKHVSGRDALSPLIKSKLERLKLYNEDGTLIIDEYGLPKLLDSNAAYGTLIRILNKDLSINAMEKTLERVLEIHPWVSQVLKIIKQEPFRSQFFTNFRKDAVSYSVVSKEKDANGNYAYKTFIVNNKTAEDAILEDLTEATKEGLVSIFKDVDPITGAVKVNTEQLEQAQATIEKVRNFLYKANHIFTKKELNEFMDKNFTEIKSLLDGLAIPVSSSILNLALNKVNTEQDAFKVADIEAIQIFEGLYKAFQIIEQNKDTENYTPFKGMATGSVRGYFLQAAKSISQFLSDDIEGSVFENGKLYYSFVVPSYLGKLMINLKDSSQTEFQEFVDKEFRRSSWFYDSKGGFYSKWLEELTSVQSKESRKLLDHKVQLHFGKSNYSDQSEIEYPLSLMQEYFSDFSDKPRFAWFHVPILADKPSSEFIKFRRYTDQNTEIGYKQELINQISRIGLQELKRIKTVLERSTVAGISQINNFDINSFKDLGIKGGGKFHFLPFLNSLLLQEGSFRNYVLEYLSGDTNNIKDLYNIIQQETLISLDSGFEKAFSKWEELGLTEFNDKGNKLKYLSNVASNKEDLKEKLREYYYNSYVASANIIQLTVSDLAYYKNVEDFQKRFSQTHSPALKGNIYATDATGIRFTADGIERTIYLKDDIIKSDIKGNIEEIFDKKINNPNLNKNQKKTLERTKEAILRQFDEINVADAQGYTSITGIRKKLGIFGRWTSKMEEAYERIQGGNWDLSDIDIMWQPLKPFVFTNTHKDSYSQTIEYLKIPITNKNSEYVLLLAGAIISGAKGGKNKLAALSDFMEKNNIDTIQFESAVKTGKQGAISLKNIDQYEEVIDTLNNYTYSDTSNKVFNPQIVHEISFDDYGIQQEVPEHLIDHNQQIGSQGRKLIMADLSIDALFNIGDRSLNKSQLREEYNALITANIEEDFNTLVENLQLDNPSRFERNLAMSNLLSEEIKKNSRYGPDLLRAVTLTPEGEFTIPLVDPIHSNQIQQLLASIIKSRIVKQKGRGGPTVLVAAYGLSEDLQIKFKDNGAIEYMECYLPAYSKEFLKPLLDKDKDGKTFLNINKVNKDGHKILSEDLRQIIGYRIPTEDKYSMNPLYIKGFLPENAGSAVMLPREITLLAGSDFDVDKLYLMLPEFNKEKGVFEKVKYDDFKSVKENSRDQRNNRMLDMMYSVLTNSDTSDKIFNPGGFDTQKKTARLISLAKNNPGQLQYSELAKLTLDQLDKLVEKYVESSQLSILDPTTQAYFHKQNTVAKKLIGAIANHNTSHAVMQENPVSFKMQTELTLNGVSINSNLVLDKDLSLDGTTYISKNTGSTLAASVDAVKDPVLDTLNLNPFTINVGMGLLRLGFDSDTVGLLLAQSSIIELTRDYFKKSSEGYVSGESLIDEALKKRVAELGGGINLKDKINTIHTNEFTKNDLFTQLGVIKEEETNKDREYQLDALILFKELYKKGKDLNELTFMTKFDTTNSVPASIAEFLSNEVRVGKFKNNFIKKFSLDNPNSVFILDNESTSFINSFYEYTKRSFEKVFSDNFPYLEIDYLAMIERLEALNDGSSLTTKVIDQALIDYTAFKFSQLDLFKGDLETRKKFLYEFPSRVAKELLDNPELIDNNLIKVLKKRGPDAESRIPFDTINIKVGGLNIDAKQNIKNGWNQLIENPKYRDIALDLITYNFYRAGFEFSPVTIMHLATIEGRQELEGYIDFLRPSSETSIFSKPEEYHFNNSINAFVDQFVRNNPNDSRLTIMKNIDEITVLHSSEEVLIIDEDLTFGEEGGPRFLHIVESDNKGKSKKYLYQHTGVGRYSPTSRLGVDNNAKEYDFYADAEMESVVENNSAHSISLRADFNSSKTSIESLEAIIESVGISAEQFNNEIAAALEIDPKELDKSQDTSKIDIVIRQIYPDFDQKSQIEQNRIRMEASKNLIDGKGELIC